MKPYGYRILLLASCLAVFGFCFVKLNQSYDPLARYPYVNEENEAIILEHMDEQDIDYMVTQHIKPEEFMPFIEVEGFDIHQTRSYTIAKETQDADNEYIVNFINKYHSHFRRDELGTLLEHYSYLDLTTFYENEQLLNENLQLVVDPSDFRVLLDENHTVYKYYPDNIQESDGYFIKENVIEHLQEMQTNYATMMSGQTLNVFKGFTTYDTLAQEYVAQQAQFMDQTMRFYRPAGQSEQQLGYTVVLDNAPIWNELCLANLNEQGEIDYAAVEASLDDIQRNQIVWLEENAYHYGFVIRYPQGKEDVTGFAHQPFVLRYVGKKQAKKMNKSKEALEEVDLKGWKE